MANTAVKLTDGSLEATFEPDLGMVCCSLTHEGEELLELRGGLPAYAERGSTFGVPLLYPWANRLGGWSYAFEGRRVQLDRESPVVHRDGTTGLPIHGLLAASRAWAVTDRGPALLSAELDFGAHPELLALFPFPHRIELSAATTTGRLAIRVKVTATDDRPVPISFGFHPYLRLPSSDRGEWWIELAVARRAVLDERGLPTGAHEPLAAGALDGPLGDRTFDDSFDELRAPARFTLADARRRIAVEFEHGYTVAQVYAPTASQFICFEPMTAPIDALGSGGGLQWALPDMPFTAEFAIAVSSQPGTAGG